MLCWSKCFCSAFQERQSSTAQVFFGCFLWRITGSLLSLSSLVRCSSRKGIFCVFCTTLPVFWTTIKKYWNLFDFHKANAKSLMPSNRYHYGSNALDTSHQVMGAPCFINLTCKRWSHLGSGCPALVEKEPLEAPGFCGDCLYPRASSHSRVPNLHASMTEWTFQWNCVWKVRNDLLTQFLDVYSAHLGSDSGELRSTHFIRADFRGQGDQKISSPVCCVLDEHIAYPISVWAAASLLWMETRLVGETPRKASRPQKNHTWADHSSQGTVQKNYRGLKLTLRRGNTSVQWRVKTRPYWDAPACRARKLHSISHPW